MADKSNMTTPLNRVFHLGSAKEGVEHWWAQRVSSVALIPLTILFMIPFIGALGGSHAEVIEAYRSPFNALVAMLFIIVTFMHLAQGLQVVIEDYVHDKPMRTAMLLANTMLSTVLGAAGVFAVARIAFGA